MARQYGLICLALGLFMMTADNCQAQLRIRHQLVQRPLRALGHGNGPGIHHCNPGPDVSYYNPWTHKNSFLISKSPEFLSRYGHEIQRSPMQLLYANSQQSQFSNAGRYQGNAMPMNAEFVPSIPKPAAEEGDDRDESDSASEEVEDRFDKEVEDRFDKEVDEMEDFGGFDSLEEDGSDSKATEGPQPGTDPDATTAAEGASLLQPSGVFLPTSYPVYRTGK